MRLIKNMKLAIAALFLGVAFMPALALSGTVHAQAANTNSQAVCEGVTLAGGTCGGDTQQFTKIIKLVIQILSFVAGIAAVIMIIIAGIRYSTSGGEASKVAGAKSAIIYAIVGLVVVALSQFIVRYVLGNVK